MKTILSVTLSAIFALAMMSGCATNDKQSSSQPTVTHGKLLDASGKPMAGCCMMQNGTMMVMDNDKLKPMKKNMTMSDGTVCMVNGTCVMKGGSKRKLAEGEVISPAGGVFHAKGLTLPGAWF